MLKASVKKLYPGCVSVSEAAEIFRVQRSTVGRWLKFGDLKGVREGKNFLAVRLTDIEATMRRFRWDESQIAEHLEAYKKRNSASPEEATPK
jgi:excisionase family DNA binding protein